MTTWVTVCDTCKREGWSAETSEQTDGEVLAAKVESAVAALGDADVRTRRFSCLMGCAGACNVTVQAAGKICYTVGRFDPDVESAEAIANYAALHAASETGQVRFREWPQAIKGHFVTRHLPLPDPE